MAGARDGDTGRGHGTEARDGDTGRERGHGTGRDKHHQIKSERNDGDDVHCAKSPEMKVISVR